MLIKRKAVSRRRVASCAGERLLNLKSDSPSSVQALILIKDPDFKDQKRPEL